MKGPKSPVGRQRKSIGKTNAKRKHHGNRGDARPKAVRHRVMGDATATNMDIGGSLARFL